MKLILYIVLMISFTGVALTQNSLPINKVGGQREKAIDPYGNAISQPHHRAMIWNNDAVSAWWSGVDVGYLNLDWGQLTDSNILPDEVIDGFKFKYGTNNMDPAGESIAYYYFNSCTGWGNIGFQAAGFGFTGLPNGYGLPTMPPGYAWIWSITVDLTGSGYEFLLNDDDNFGQVFCKLSPSLMGDTGAVVGMPGGFGGNGFTGTEDAFDIYYPNGAYNGTWSFGGYPYWATWSGALFSGGSVIEENHATLVAHNDDHIHDWELAQYLKNSIGDNYHSRILTFTQCFGGDLINDFENSRQTTILTSNEPGKVAYYDYSDSAYAENMIPGNTTDKLHESAKTEKHSDETLQYSGPDQTIGAVGDIKSCHVLFWAGDPNSIDRKQFDEIHGNFPGPENTVTVLAGDGDQQNWGPNVDGPATRESLKTELENIKKLMNSEEQFILFVSDHGDLDSSRRSVPCSAGSSAKIDIEIPTPLYGDMLIDPANHPFIGLVTSNSLPILPGDLEIWLNGMGPIDVGSSMVETPLDLDFDLVPDRYRYHLTVDESYLSSGYNRVTLRAATNDLLLSYVSLDSGGIGKPIVSSLAVDPLTAGQTGTFTLTHGVPNTPTYLAYSVAGVGSTWYPPLNVMINLLAPKKAAGPTMSDPSGAVGWNLMIPSGSAGLNVWLQAVQNGLASNMVDTSIN